MLYESDDGQEIEELTSEEIRQILGSVLRALDPDRSEEATELAIRLVLEERRRKSQ